MAEKIKPLEVGKGWRLLTEEEAITLHSLGAEVFGWHICSNKDVGRVKRLTGAIDGGRDERPGWPFSLRMLELAACWDYDVVSTALMTRVE